MANTHSLDLERDNSQYVYITDANQTGLDITGDFSIELWINPESATVADTYRLVGKYTSGVGYHLSIDNNNKLVVIYEDSSSNRTKVSSSNTIIDSGDIGNWIHLAVTVDVSSKTIVMYKNGSSISISNNETNASSVGDNASDFQIGNLNDGNYFDGKIDEVRVWNDIRTSTEISDNYQKELTGSEANLVGYWKFNNNYTDETSNSNDLTAANNPVFSTDVPFTDSENYTLTAANGSLALTGQSSNLLKSLKIISSQGSFVLTGFAAALKIGFGILAEMGSFTLNGIAAILKSARTIAVSVGSFILRGQSAILKRCLKLIANTGYFILTGKTVRLLLNGISTVWKNISKNTSSWNNKSKNTSSWTNKTKS